MDASVVPAAYVKASPSGSAKYSDPAHSFVSATVSRWSGIVPVTTGAWFGTITSKLSVTVNPPSSVAVTVIVAVPFATACTVSVVPEIDTAATLSSDVSGA